MLPVTLGLGTCKGGRVQDTAACGSSNASPWINVCLCLGWQYIFLCKKISPSWKKNIKGTKDPEAISWKKGLQGHKRKVVKISLPGTDAQIGAPQRSGLSCHPLSLEGCPLDLQVLHDWRKGSGRSFLALKCRESVIYNHERNGSENFRRKSTWREKSGHSQGISQPNSIHSRTGKSIYKEPRQPSSGNGLPCFLDTETQASKVVSSISGNLEVVDMTTVVVS